MSDALETEEISDRLAKRLRKLARQVKTELLAQSKTFKTHPGLAFDELVVMIDDELGLED